MNFASSYAMRTSSTLAIPPFAMKRHHSGMSFYSLVSLSLTGILGYVTQLRRFGELIALT